MDISQLYNNISKEFDNSRYSVWKGVKEFLNSLPANSTLCEIGCGNGKNLLYRNDLIVKGYDISSELIGICKNKGLDVEYGDVTNLSTKDNSLDNVISIAVIHHLQSKELRIKAMSELLRITRPGGRILIYVWAFEQPENSKRKFAAGDNLVPFITKNGSSPLKNGEIYNRFYHVYSEGELEREIKDLYANYKFDIEQIYWELGNWCAILKK